MLNETCQIVNFSFNIKAKCIWMNIFGLDILSSIDILYKDLNDWSISVFKYSKNLSNKILYLDETKWM